MPPAEAFILLLTSYLRRPYLEKNEILRVRRTELSFCNGPTRCGHSFHVGCKYRAHTNGGVQQRTLLRRVLRRVLETAFEKVLRRVLRRCLAVGFNGKKVLRRVLRRGSKKGLSRRHPRRQKHAFSRVRPPWRVP